MILKASDKKLIESFEDLVDTIRASTSIDVLEPKEQKAKRIKFLLSNYVAFCLYYFPEYCYAEFSKFHKLIQPNIINNPNEIHLAQWSRGFAKTTHLGLFVPLFLKFNGRLTGMIVGSHDESMAAMKLDDIRANLQANERIINDFGVQQSYGNWEAGMFKTTDDVAFYGFGKRQSPRGYKFRWKRPNYGLVDDLNDKRELKNDEIAGDDRDWVIEELKPALWTREWWVVVAQNKFHDNTVTALLEDDEDIKTRVFRIDIRDAKGKSNWIENPDFSEAAINILEDTEGGGFIRERMNTPFEEGTTFKTEWLTWCKALELREYDGVLIHYLDPSYKATDKSDYKFWVLLGRTGIYYDILKAWGRKTDSKEMWEYAYEIDQWVGDKQTVYHSMEGNFIQEEIHKNELERVEEDEGYALRLQYDHRKKDNKQERIETLQPLFKRGLIRFNEAERQNEGMKLLKKQLLAFQRGSRINDDGPDALEGAVFIADRFTKRRGKGTRSGKYKKKSRRGM
jgi:hypothetical protein